jgi:Protein of unknown function (DUF3829)
MISFRSFCSTALVLFASGAAGCKQDPPPPLPEAVSSAASSKGKANLKTPASALPKVDPQTMKEYRADVCYFGTLTLKQARDAYFASLGKDEPSEKKVPNFGNAEEPKPGAAAVKPAGSAAAKPAGSAAAKPAAAVAARPAGSAGKSASPLAMDLPVAPRADVPPLPRLDDRKPFNFPLRAPHERNARACTVAVSLKDPSMPELDTVLSEYAPYAVELAKNIAAATNYYQREEYKKDKFEKGKELHKQLVAGFEKLDAMSEKLGAAVNAWHKGHLPDLASADEGQKAALTGFEDARALMLGLVTKGVDVAAARAALQKLEGSTEALKSFGTGHPTDPWGKIMSPALDAFVRAVKEAEPKLSDKGIAEPSLFLPVVTSFVSLIEAKHRAHNRALIAKGQAQAASSAATDKPAEAPAEK